MFRPWPIGIVLVVTLSGVATTIFARYTIKDLQVKAARDYSTHQAFQSLVIAAHPCTTQDAAQDLFDTKKLIEKGIMPVLIVVENENDFPVRLHEDAIFLVDPLGRRNPVIHFVDVLLEINLKRPVSSYPTRKEVLLRQAVRREMYLDFEHKSFGERLIAPHGSDQGVVFFRLPEDGTLEDHRLYFPEVVNFATQEPLMFFELYLD